MRLEASYPVFIAAAAPPHLVAQYEHTQEEHNQYVHNQDEHNQDDYNLDEHMN